MKYFILLFILYISSTSVSDEIEDLDSGDLYCIPCDKPSLIDRFRSFIRSPKKDFFRKLFKRKNNTRFYNIKKKKWDDCSYESNKDNIITNNCKKIKNYCSNTLKKLKKPEEDKECIFNVYGDSLISENNFWGPSNKNKPSKEYKEILKDAVIFSDINYSSSESSEKYSLNTFTQMRRNKPKQPYFEKTIKTIEVPVRPPRKKKRGIYDEKNYNYY